MSRMRLDRKPPLPKSPVRLQSRRVLRSNAAATQSMQTPPGSLTKSQKLTRSWDIDEAGLRPEYQSISCQLHELAKMVSKELGGENMVDAGYANDFASNSVSVFERGRFYDVYSARRNERLKRKKGESGEEKKAAYDLGVSVESTKRRDTKKLGSSRKSISIAYSVERNASEGPRYLLRSSTKENKKPPVPVNIERSALGTERRIGTRRTKKI